MSFFDPISFVLGAGVGVAAGAGGMYALKDRLNFGALATDDPNATSNNTDGDGGVGGFAADFLSPQASGRYIAGLTEYFQNAHLGGDVASLTDILVEPRFIQNRPPILYLPDPEEGILEDADIYRVIPMLHQYPSIYASFNMDTISLKDLETGSQHIAIIGKAGQGKTTALATLGLITLGALDMEDFRTYTQRPIDDEEEFGDVSEERRKQLIKEREEVESRAVQQLRIVQNREDEAEAIDLLDDEVDFTTLFPIYIHLHHVDLTPDTYNGIIDPAEPIIRALPNYLDKSTSVLSAPLLYRQLSEGNALVLLDGYDELTIAQQRQALEWLDALVKFYGNNRIVMAAPASGYDALTNLGFSTIAIRPFSPLMADRLREKWIAFWEQSHDAVNAAIRDVMMTDNRNRPVIELTLKFRALLLGDIQVQGRRGYYEHYVRHHLGELEYGLDALKTIATEWLNKNDVPEPDTLDAIARHFLGFPPLDQPEPEVEDEDEDGKKKKKAKKAEEPEGSKEVAEFLQQLAATNLIHENPNGKFHIANAVVGWYLAAENLYNIPPQPLAQLAFQPNWHDALSFASAIVDLEPAVLQKVQSQPDLIYQNMFSVADWMPDAPSELRWKSEILKRLGQAAQQTNQFPLIRAYAVAALVTARDESGGVPYIFRQAVRSASPALRVLGCIGIGALGSEEGVSDLNQMLFDESTEVQLAAGLALGAIGTEASLTAMTEGLLTGEENLRKAVAEAFSAIPGEGHAILYDGVTHNDLAVRRACAFGLARIPSLWSLVALYRAMLEDHEWYVRQAAERAFAQAREPRASGPRHYPEPEYYEWLRGWVTQRGESIPEGVGGRSMLLTALQHAPTEVRIESARALGRLGYANAIKSLYSSLGDKDAPVRGAAFEALGQLSVKLGRPMPSVL